MSLYRPSVSKSRVCVCVYRAVNRYGPGSGGRIGLEVVFLVVFIFEWGIEIANAVAACKIKGIKVHFSNVWRFVHTGPIKAGYGTTRKRN